MAAMFFVVTMALYFAATVSFLIYLLWPSEVLANVSLGMTATGFAAHTVALGAGMIGATDISSPGFHEALSFFSWMLILVFLAVEFRHHLHVLGSFIVPLALLSLVSAAALPEAAPTLTPVFRTLWVHVTLSMLGTVGFAVAFVAGVMYLIQDGLLKSKRFNVLYSKLPALDFLDNLNQRSIVTGFPAAHARHHYRCAFRRVLSGFVCELESRASMGACDMGVLLCRTDWTSDRGLES